MDQNVSKNSTSTNNNSSPPISPPNTPNETNPTEEGFETIAKTSEEVLDELNNANDETNENVDNGGANEVDGAQGGIPKSMSVALVADGSNTSVVEQVGGGDNHVQLFKKRKYKQVRDPPVGIHTCPICKGFATWRAAFGHMNKHPQRPYHGFFPPLTLTPTAPVVGIRVAEGASAPAENEESRRKKVFDLNELPSNEDDDEIEEK